MTGALPVLGETITNVGLWTTTAAPYLAMASPVALAIWFWWAVRRARLVRACLADRVTVEAVPTSTFDPAPGEIGRWANHLGRVYHSAEGVPARGSAVRLRYSAEGGRMHCYLEGPATAAAVLAMPGFAEVEVRVRQDRKTIEPVRFPTAGETAA